MKETNMMYPSLIKAKSRKLENNEVDYDSLIETSSTGQDNQALVNNNSITSFKIDENEITITRSIGKKKYSTMSFQPTPSKMQVDILVTQGLYRTEYETQALNMNAGRTFFSQSKLPDPPWPAKLCLGFVFALVIAMSVMLIIVMIMHNHNSSITQSQIKVEEPEIIRAFIDGDNATFIGMNATRKEVVSTLKYNLKDLEANKAVVWLWFLCYMATVLELR